MREQSISQKAKAILDRARGRELTEDERTMIDLLYKQSAPSRKTAPKTYKSMWQYWAGKDGLMQCDALRDEHTAKKIQAAKDFLKGAE